MPWYYIEVHSGGGHQSTTSKWTWRDKPAPIKTSADIENFVDGEFDGHYFGGDSAIFHVKRVSKLPAMIHERLVKSQGYKVVDATRMMKVLRATKTHPPRCTAQTSRYPKDGQLAHLLSRCNKRLGHRGKHDATGRTNREKFGDF